MEGPYTPDLQQTYQTASALRSQDSGSPFQDENTREEASAGQEEERMNATKGRSGRNNIKNNQRR